MKSYIIQNDLLHVHFIQYVFMPGHWFILKMRVTLESRTCVCVCGVSTGKTSCCIVIWIRKCVYTKFINCCAFEILNWVQTENMHSSFESCSVFSIHVHWHKPMPSPILFYEYHVVSRNDQRENQILRISAYGIGVLVKKPVSIRRETWDVSWTRIIRCFQL